MFPAEQEHALPAIPSVACRFGTVQRKVLNFLQAIFALAYSPPNRSNTRLLQAMDQAELARVFQMFDRNGDGRITRKELSDSLKNLGITISEQDLTQMIEKIDVNGDGYVDIDEFGELYQTIMDEKDEEGDMREAFNVFDQNGDGFITGEELSAVLCSLGLKHGKTIDYCMSMIKKVDVDGDGMVNFQEFKQMMKEGGFVSPYLI
ncbi:unnamed protein product [Sphenostylis stenocarpa]|uniref:EF-hand domain-containing protein n=1 Tax=Sphenostylis stenocarpa TaxID=92480 RepID=A0AA86S5F2_9FABA|nr:unnamed protein product [Sphenostylis stenocarpa]